MLRRLLVVLEFLVVDVQLSIGNPLDERLRLRVRRLEPRPAGSYQTGQFEETEMR